MGFRTELAKIALKEVNKLTKVCFEDFTTDYDLSDTAAAEYDGVILQIYFPNPAAGWPKFQMVKTDSAANEVTTNFRNKDGGTDLNFQEVIDLVNSYVSQEEKAFHHRQNPPD